MNKFEQKNEAIERMKSLKLMKTIITEFEKDEVIYISEG